MKTYARLDGGRVAEILATDGDVAAMFSPLLHWVDATAAAGVAPGWMFDGAHFAPPPAPPTAVPPSAPSTAAVIASLQARLNQIAAELAALTAAH